jgi:hypothetical protein
MSSEKASVRISSINQITYGPANIAIKFLELNIRFEQNNKQVCPLCLLCEIAGILNKLRLFNLIGWRSGFNGLRVARYFGEAKRQVVGFTDTRGACLPRACLPVGRLGRDRGRWAGTLARYFLDK